MQLIKNIKGKNLSIFTSEQLKELNNAKNLLKFLSSLISDFDFISEYELAKNISSNNKNLVSSKTFSNDNFGFVLENLIKSCFKIIETKIILNEKSINLIYVIEAGVPPYIKTDYKKLKQILMNLLSNAFKYTNHGYIKLNVDFKSQNLFFKISDTGIGINLNGAEKDYEFGIVNNPVQGTSLSSDDIIKLGLFIVQKQVNQLGGKFLINKRRKIGTLAKFNVKIREVPNEYKKNIIKSITKNERNKHKIFSITNETNQSNLEAINTLNYMKIPKRIKKKFEFSTIMNKFSQTRVMVHPPSINNNDLAKTNIVNNHNPTALLKDSFITKPTPEPKQLKRSKKNFQILKENFTASNYIKNSNSNCNALLDYQKHNKNNFSHFRDITFKSIIHKDVNGAAAECVSESIRDIPNDTLFLKDFQFKFIYNKLEQIKDQSFQLNNSSCSVFPLNSNSNLLNSQSNIIISNNSSMLPSPRFLSDLSLNFSSNNNINSNNNIALKNIFNNNIEYTPNNINNNFSNLNSRAKTLKNNSNKILTLKSNHSHIESESLSDTKRLQQFELIKALDGCADKSKLNHQNLIDCLNNNKSFEDYESDSNTESYSNSQSNSDSDSPGPIMLPEIAPQVSLTKPVNQINKVLDEYNHDISNRNSNNENNTNKKANNSSNVNNIVSKTNTNPSNYLSINVNNQTMNQNSNQICTRNNSFEKKSTYKKKVTSENKPSRQSNSVKGLKILVVDDEKLIRQSAMKIISKYLDENSINYQIEECSDGIEALYKIYLGLKSGFRYDIIFTDETMNFMNGSKMASILRDFIKSNIVYQLKLVMVTSYEVHKIDPNIVAKFDLVFTKPLSKTYLENVFY